MKAHGRSEQIVCALFAEVKRSIFYAMLIDKCALNAYNRIEEGSCKMKRRDLIKLLEHNGWRFDRNGGSHDLYTNGEKSEPIPRHNEINERLAKAIIRKHDLK